MWVASGLMEGRKNGWGWGGCLSGLWIFYSYNKVWKYWYPLMLFYPLRVKGVGRLQILLKEKIHTYMVSKNLSLCLSVCYIKLSIFLLLWASRQNRFSKFLASSLMNKKIKTISKKVCTFWVLEQFLFAPFDKKVNFWLNNYLDSHHSQGGMKFATQISPLINSSYK